MDAFRRVAVVVIQVDARGKAEEVEGLLMTAQLGGKNRMDGRRKGRFVNTARLVIFIIRLFFRQAEKDWL